MEPPDDFGSGNRCRCQGRAAAVDICHRRVTRRGWL